MKNNTIIILGLTTLVIIAIGFFFVKPVVSSVLSDWNSLNKAREDLRAVEEKKNVVEELKKNPNLSNISTIALKYIPETSESGSLIIELTAMANQNNLKVVRTAMEQQKTTKTTSSEDTDSGTKSKTPAPSTSATPASSDYKELQFSITLNGTYSDFMNFLRAVDSSTRLISLKMLALRIGEQKAGQTTANFDADITGVAFYKPDVSVEKNLENLKISDDVIQKFLNLKTYGSPINLPTESGFGRSNPFEGY